MKKCGNRKMVWPAAVLAAIFLAVIPILGMAADGVEPGNTGTVPVESTAPSASAEPGPSASEEPGPSPSEEPGPSASAEPGPSASAEPSPSATEEPGPSASESPARRLRRSPAHRRRRSPARRRRRTRPSASAEPGRRHRRSPSPSPSAETQPVAIGSPAGEITVSTADELIFLAQTINSGAADQTYGVPAEQLNVTLAADIDLAGAPFPSMEIW
jgi:hypothetical protein